MSVSERGHVGPVARALGFAGLLPQIGAICLIAFVPHYAPGAILALFYPLLILSFLGGMWWGFAMRRPVGQGRWVAIAVVPSLLALALFVAAVAALIDAYRLASGVLVAIGLAVMLTLIVDRHLARTGVAPEGWMRLRVPLSIGLGGLTIVAGVLLAN